MSDFAACAAKGQYDHVPAAEACSIGVAQIIGVYDASSWFVDPFVNTTKTQSEDATAVAEDSNRPSALCAAASDPAMAHVAYPLCGVMVGPGTAMAEKADGTAECVTAACPPGFTPDGTACTRPSVPRTVAQASRCDARWYDWFNVENAHLGNGVASGADGSTCYAPCPAGFVPNAATDPADGAPVSLSAKDDPSTCVPKTSFFYGAYAGTPDYAPLAWIYRLTTRPEDFVSTVEDAVAALDASGAATGTVLVAGAAAAAVKAATATAGDVYTAMSKASLDISGAAAISTNARYLRAAKTLNTDDRLRYALAVCQKVSADPAGAVRTWGAGWGAQSAQKLALLRSACQAVCCDANNMASIGAKPVCFAAADLSSASAAAADRAAAKAAAAAAKKKKQEDALAAKGVGSPGELAFYKSARFAVLLLVVPVVVIVLWVLLWPIALKVYRAMLTNYDPDSSALENAQVGVINREFWSQWKDFLWRNMAAPVGKVASWAGTRGEGLVSYALKGMNDNLFGYLFKGVAFLIVLFVLCVPLPLFIYFSIVPNDVHFSQAGSFYRGLERFFNAFNYHDWVLFNPSQWWPVRVVNEMLNPYRSALTPDAIKRGTLSAGRCDGVAWLPDASGNCASALSPAPLVWPLAFPEGARVPSVIRSTAPTAVTIPYVLNDAGDAFVASCDVRVGNQALLAPVDGDPNSCARVRTPLDAYTDAYRPKRQSASWAGLDGYADAAQPRCE